MPCSSFFFFFFNDTATTEIYTLSLHDALPILFPDHRRGFTLSPRRAVRRDLGPLQPAHQSSRQDRKSTRLNSSHGYISYAVFCLKKKTSIPLPPPLPYSHVTNKHPQHPSRASV